MKLTEKTRWKQEKVEFDPLEKLNRWVDKGCFFTMTHVNKLGINPRSPYNTPLGIYSYPLNTEFKILLLNRNLPFASNAPFIQIFRPKSTSKILTLDFGEGKYEQLGAKLYNVWDKWAPGALHQDFDKLYTVAEGGALVQTPAGKFWNVTRLIAKTPNKWRLLFLDIGIDGCNDPGSGIIHVNEPTQAVFFRVSALEHLDAMDNRVQVQVKRDKTLDLFLHNVKGEKIEWLVENMPELADGAEYSWNDLITYLPRPIILKLLAHLDFDINEKVYKIFCDYYLLYENANSDKGIATYASNDEVKLFMDTLLEAGRRELLEYLVEMYEHKYEIYSAHLQGILDRILPIMKAALQ